MVGCRSTDLLLAGCGLWILDSLFQLHADQERFDKRRNHSLPYQLCNVHLRQCCCLLLYWFSGIFSDF